MTWILRYRVGGRGGLARRLTLGDARKVSLKDARDAARMAWGERAKGSDPQAARKAAARRERAQLGFAVDGYIKDLERRGATAVRTIRSLLRRELVAPLGEATDLSTLDRARLAARVSAIADSGRPGTAREFRTRCSVLLNWAVGRGLIEHNPLLGLRLPRATRSEEVAIHGRALREAEIRAFWEAAEAIGDPIYAGYLRTLLLTGCRRTELAQSRWGWVRRADDTDRTVLMLPAKITKNGRAHAVPLPEPVLKLLSALPRRVGSDLIFPSWRGVDTAMSGWSKRWTSITAAMAELGVIGRVTMHDLRRTARSWWSELGVVEPVAELMLNHRPRSRLVALYDRSERMDERHAAAERWAEFVFGLIEGGRGRCGTQG
jgi:integrase